MGLKNQHKEKIHPNSWFEGKVSLSNIWASWTGGIWFWTTVSNLWTPCIFIGFWTCVKYILGTLHKGMGFRPTLFQYGGYAYSTGYTWLEQCGHYTLKLKFRCSGLVTWEVGTLQLYVVGNLITLAKRRISLFFFSFFIFKCPEFWMVWNKKLKKNPKGWFYNRSFELR